MEFQCQGTPDGRLEFNAYTKNRFKQFLSEQPTGIRLTITPDLPESGKLRRYFEGAVVPLIAYFQEGMDHRNSEDRRNIREWLKAEFNGDMIEIDGKVHTVAKSTKGRAALNPFVERVIDWLNENYAPPAEALDPEKYKRWKDEIYSHGGPDTYIDYLVARNILKPYGETV